MIVDTKTGERFAGRNNLDAGKVDRLVRDGIWTKADLDLHGLAEAPDPIVPVPEPVREPTDQERLEGAVGMPLDRIKAVLGITAAAR